MAAYARVAVPRSALGWLVSGNVASLAAVATFPQMAGGAGGVVTNFGVGTAASGAGELLYFGAVDPTVSVVIGVAPVLDTNTQVVQASGDAMANAAATDLLNLLFNNTAWANFGDAGGLQPSGAAGSLYLSLHVGSPTESGDQTTNEFAYS